jgi:hypothetical protein
MVNLLVCALDYVFSLHFFGVEEEKSADHALWHYRNLYLGVLEFISLPSTRSSLRVISKIGIFFKQILPQRNLRKCEELKGGKLCRRWNQSEPNSLRILGYS